MASLRCSSGGCDLGGNDTAQLVYEAVVIAVKFVLVKHEYVKYDRPNQAELPPFFVRVLEKMSSSQANLQDKNYGQLHWRHHDLNSAGRDSSNNTGSDPIP